MTRTLKLLGLSMIAALALSAVTASAAFGTAQFSENNGGGSVTVTANQIPVTITGAEVAKHKFTTVAGVVQCNTAEFMGNTNDKDTELTLNEVAYAGCTISGLGATVNMNGCHYRFHNGKDVGTEDKTFTLDTDVICPAGKKIAVTVVGSTCKVEIGGQTNLKGIEVHNETSQLTITKSPPDTTNYMDIKATIDVKESITYNVVEGNKCPNKPESKTYTNGTYEGGATITAESVDGKTHYDITLVTP